MHKALLALLIATPLAAQQPSSFDFSIRNIMRGPELYGRQPQEVRWSADNKWIYFTWLEAGSDWRDQARRFRVRAAPGSKPERVSPAAFDSVGAEVTVGERASNGWYQAVEYSGDIFLTDMKSGTTRRLTQTKVNEHDPTFSKDGSKVYYISENNVFSIDLNGGLVRQLTDLRTGPEPTDSVKPTGQRGRIEQQQRDLFEAIRDRVRADSITRAARKERDSRALKPYYTQRGEELASVSPSPDASALIITTRTPGQARGNDIPRFVTQSGYTEQIHGRDNVGDVQDKGRIGYINLTTGNLTWLKPFPSDTADGTGLPLGWSTDGAHGAFYAYTADNKTRVLQTVNATTGKLTTLETLRDSAWVDGPCASGSAGWYDGGRRFYYVSEATGFAHLYTVAADGSDRRQLTSGKWEVLNVSLSPDEKTFYLQTNEPSPAEEQFYRMSVNGGIRERITMKSGRHRVIVSPNGQILADVYSYVNRPPDLFLMPNKAGAEESQLSVSPSREWLSFNWIAPELVMAPASDGVMVPGHVYRPKDMNAQPNGAAVIFVHGAGYLHNVGNFWSEYPREYMFNQYLASALFTQAQYFGAGAAIRSVTDWTHYNHGYTSNILNSPQTATIAYRRSSPIYFAEGLKDPLLILHGMVDTNVLFADDVRLVQRLIELGKENWELAVYPVEDHAFVRPSSWTDEYKRIFRIFEENLQSRVPIRTGVP